MAYDGAFHRTPQCEVWWAGFKSDTYSLQSAGWEAALEHAHNRSYGAITMILRHAKAGWAMYCECREPYGSLLDRAWLGPNSSMRDGLYKDPPVFEVTHCRPDDKLLYFGSRPLNRDFEHVDLHPGYRNGESVARSTIFPPFAAAAKEIIVAPDQVADLLERISKLQEPELQAIQRRNQDRDRRDSVTPICHATILSIAA